MRAAEPPWPQFACQLDGDAGPGSFVEMCDSFFSNWSSQDLMLAAALFSTNFDWSILLHGLNPQQGKCFRAP